MRLIDAIIKKWFCLHKWELVCMVNIYTRESELHDMPEREERTYCCEKCGKFKKVRV